MKPTRRKRQRAEIRGPAQFRSRKHLQWVRGHHCFINGPYCMGAVEAAHIRAGTDGGMGVKPSDFWAISLCNAHHNLQHTLGEPIFWEGVGGIDKAKEAALDLARRSPCEKTREAAHGKQEAVEAS